ncbi:MAG TPA: aminoacyl-tRNA hydrolase [Candidatus Dormibacteraeota bacterium]|jgi:PTH1 family peptidyl-tRNA hydrolase|nr:aminoacyl-tRNA hydrolase [Candidatus Dormibacteraeota bacterium]
METQTGRKLVVVGLGNPGAKYAGTRHNLGQICVLELGRRLGIAIDRKCWKSDVGSAPVVTDGGESLSVGLVIPQTFMNLSGQAVGAALRDLGLDRSSLWVVYDELDLPFCRLRIRPSGSAAGHNGMRSIIGNLKTQDFVRFRVGVGRPPHPEMDPADFLLSRFTKDEAERLPTLVAGVVDALEIAIKAGIERSMEQYNRSGSLGCG